ncbi:D-alanyl-D-alanine carboxypeptidase/D-alanyl-D-alanine endopeptidase [Phytoactinopolyspora limicola]|uniref:D-alanyl-D-alanine carboxypeptidase/D-alanyl-D-alanine endopeptidase n=1 Tax=Phytoactinopolyspora limicola TaxID=2715536 RepID=UPI0014074B07|nr:D-alanyl-D-alanine carboxypeptidase/D-alanyl-D-alanine-endopeptidase [Phytoactinopolyspora limicola]
MSRRDRSKRRKSRRRLLWAAGGVVAVGAAVGAGVLGPDLLASEPAVKVAGVLSLPGIDPGWPAADVVLSAARADGDPVDDVAGRIDVLAGAAELGGHVGVAVAELGSGEVVYESNVSDGFIPASTMKILTSVAALDVLGPDHQFVTGVVMGDGGSAEAADITLVGGGDPMLASSADAATVPGAASLDQLAAATAEVLAAEGIDAVRLSFDDALFTGPAIDPDWRSTYVPNGVVAPVSALSVDGGRRDPGLRQRADDPAQAAAQVFAGALEDEGIEILDDPRRASAADDAPELVAASSPPLSTIVEYVMRTSDNDAAEHLHRHVALGSGRDGSSAEAAAATEDVLAGLGIELAGVDIRDGSGLARGNSVTAGALVAALEVAADVDRPDLRPVLGGLPVAGFTGTLAERAADGGAGYVRAKTGTLTGVHSLAGIAAGADGPAYAFAVLADDASDALAARAALDRLAAGLVRSSP